MSSVTALAKMIVLISGLSVNGYSEGVGAFYHQADMREVCRYRVERGWNPGLDCDWPCLAATMDAGDLGGYVLADLPGHSFVV